MQTNLLIVVTISGKVEAFLSFKTCLTLYIKTKTTGYVMKKVYMVSSITLEILYLTYLYDDSNLYTVAQSYLLSNTGKYRYSEPYFRIEIPRISLNFFFHVFPKNQSSKTDTKSELNMIMTFCTTWLYSQF